MSSEKNKVEVIDRIYKVIQSRKNATPTDSYVASLRTGGLKKIAEKIGEEATETIIAAVGGDRKQTVYESADLIFMLMVLWSEMEIIPKDIFEELSRREGVSGHEEKNKRTKT